MHVPSCRPLSNKIMQAMVSHGPCCTMSSVCGALPGCTNSICAARVHVHSATKKFKRIIRMVIGFLRLFGHPARVSRA